MTQLEKPLTKAEIERQLLPRLRRLGYLLLVFSLTSFAYVQLSDVASDIPEELSDSPMADAASSGLALDEPPLFVLTPNEQLRFYGMGFVFALIGSLAIFAAWKKGKQLNDAAQKNPDCRQ